MSRDKLMLSGREILTDERPRKLFECQYDSEDINGCYLRRRGTLYVLLYERGAMAAVVY